MYNILPYTCEIRRSVCTMSKVFFGKPIVFAAPYLLDFNCMACFTAAVSSRRALTRFWPDREDPVRGRFLIVIHNGCCLSTERNKWVVKKKRARSRHLNFDFMHVSTLLHCFHPLICIARPAPVKSGLPGHGWMWKPNDSISFRLLWVVMSRLIFDACHISWTVCWSLDFSVSVKHAKCLLGCDPPFEAECTEAFWHK